MCSLKCLRSLSHVTNKNGCRIFTFCCLSFGVPLATVNGISRQAKIFAQDNLAKQHKTADSICMCLCIYYAAIQLCVCRCFVVLFCNKRAYNTFITFSLVMHQFNSITIINVLLALQISYHLEKCFACYLSITKRTHETADVVFLSFFHSM